MVEQMPTYYSRELEAIKQAVRINFKIVYQPYDVSKHHSRRYFVSFYRLCIEVGENNAFSIAKRALKSTGDNLRTRLRTHGIIDFYVK